MNLVDTQKLISMKAFNIIKGCVTCHPKNTENENGFPEIVNQGSCGSLLFDKDTIARAVSWASSGQPTLAWWAGLAQPTSARWASSYKWARPERVGPLDSWSTKIEPSPISSELYGPMDHPAHISKCIILFFL